MSLNSGPVPKYYQLTELLRAKISSGEFQINQQIPSEDQLCREFQVSRGTARRAISELVHEGLLRCEQGRGTFVVHMRSRTPHFSLTQFNEEMLTQRRRPRTRLLLREIVPATKTVAQRLELVPGEPVIHVVRLRLADERPVIHEARYLSHALCPHLMEEDLENQSVHTLLVHKYQLPLIRTVHMLEARVLSQEQAILLEAPPDTAAFFVDRLTYTTIEGRERPAVWYQAVFRGDEYHFRVEFEAQA